MKNTSKLMVIIAVLLSNISAFAQISKAEIVATGLTCSMCSNAINKQLKNLPDVDKVAIDLNSNTFTVTLKTNNTITPRLLKEKVEKAGFFVGSMIITMDFDKQKIQNNLKIKKGELNIIFIDSDSKTVNGLSKFQVLDKGYVVAKEYKKLAKTYANYSTFAANNENDYHLKSL